MVYHLSQTDYRVVDFLAWHKQVDKLPATIFGLGCGPMHGHLQFSETMVNATGHTPFRSLFRLVYMHIYDECLEEVVHYPSDSPHAY